MNAADRAVEDEAWDLNTSFEYDDAYSENAADLVVHQLAGE